MKYLRSSILVLIIANSASLLNWIFQFTIARVLAPTEFAIIGAVAALGPIIFSVFSVIPQLVSRTCLDNKISALSISQRLNLLRTMIFSIGGILVFLLIIFSGPVSRYLNIENNLPVIIYGGTSLASVVLLYYTGLLQANMMFVSIALKDFIAISFKLCLGIVFVFIFHKSYNGVLFGELLGNLLAIFFLFILLRRVKTNNFS